MQIQNDKKYGAVSFGGGPIQGGSPFSATPATQKVTVNLPTGCSGISFQRQDDPSNWATIAYNLGT